MRDELIMHDMGDIYQRINIYISSFIQQYIYIYIYQAFKYKFYII